RQLSWNQRRKFTCSLDPGAVPHFILQPTTQQCTHRQTLFFDRDEQQNLIW
ncbi:hypothetical protein JMJ77_0000480, partial [Colletotrichum scovillei]